MKKKLSLPEMGAEARRELGDESDWILLEKVMQSPGITMYELSKELGWTKGRVQGSVNRLLQQNAIRKKKVILNDRILTKIFPIEYKEPQAGIIEIAYEAVNPKLWTHYAVAGAMNRITIRIVPEERADEITSKAFFHEKLSIEYRDNSVVFKLSQRFRDFYMLDNSILGVSTTSKGDAVIGTIEGTITEINAQNTTDAILPTIEFREVSSPDNLNQIIASIPTIILHTSIMKHIKSLSLELGLTHNEAGLYIYLAAEGPKRARDIAKSLQIPRTETYHLLSSLLNKGLLAVTTEHPIQFSIVPIKGGLNKLLKGKLLTNIE